MRGSGRGANSNRCRPTVYPSFLVGSREFPDRIASAHALGHLVAHGDLVWGVKQVEQQAHYFAAAFLMPARDIAHELPARPDWPRLVDLKRKWQVSLGALLMRARALGRMSKTST